MAGNYGTDANDRIIGTASDEQTYGGNGNDILTAAFVFTPGSGTPADPFSTLITTNPGGSDTLYGGDGNDGIFGSIGNDVIYGGDGDDTGNMIGFGGFTWVSGLYGGSGDDYIDGGRGNDLVDGGDGADRLYGGDGFDQLFGGSGDDVLYGGAGFDDNLFGGAGNDKLFGGDDGSFMNGDDGNDLVIGGSHGDTLKGGGGSDTLRGGDGGDVLSGDGGKDILFGGDGADFFFVTSKSDSPKGAGRDVVKDFSHAQHDQIDVKLIDANTKKAGDQAFKYIGDSAFHHVRGELHEIQLANKTLVEGDTNGDGKADFQIELTGHLNLVKGDFIL